MKQRLFISTIALLACAVSAHGLTVQIVTPAPTKPTDFSDIYQIAKFNPALGQLTMVTVRLNAALDASLIAENRSNMPALITGNVTQSATLTPPTGPILTGSQATTPVTPQSVAAYDGVPFTNELPNGPFGADTFRWTIVNGIVDQSNVYNTPADLAFFTGAGTLDYTLAGDSSYMLSSNTGNIAAQASATVGGQIIVTYEYIPEPASLGLFGLGALMIVRRRR